ncbi:hypothetical protein EHR01_17985 [Leptospira mtsangambouensis]|uniref:Lipoprotein n=1 Tax=Leptospira mtsangambouensis TaxID=2484912 RepID=A0ABY2NY08_9LEPT|nr:hypothetical protein [Leptospira mtsangambouensis]TGM73096.1 hypothetical protein EHR01_17985 [Leptospira mtsangambouensis]
MRTIGLLISLSFFLQCATYWKNRKNDFQDIVTVGAETPMYGAALKVGPLPIGFVFQGGESEMGKKDLGRGLGLRGGQFGTYHSQQLVFGILGGESFHSGLPLLDAKGNWLVDKKGIPLTSDERANVKSYKMRYYSYIYDPVKDRKRRKKEHFRRELTKDIVASTGQKEFLVYLPEEDLKPFGYPPGYSWNVEVTAGVYGGARLGFNVAEAFDFLLGFTTVDLLDDDVEGKVKPSFPGFPFPAPTEAETDSESVE